MKQKGAFWLLTGLAILASVGGWLWRRSHLSPPAEISSRYLYSGNVLNGTKPLCAVFVHGVFGDDTTWGKGELTLPKLLATDSQLSNQLDVFLFEYSSPYLGDASKISDLSEQLRGALEDHHVWDHEKVIFVAHSMGGLVVRQYLVAHRESIPKVSMLYFYAVPTDGAAVTDVARIISHNPQLKGMLPLEGNDFLNSIRNSWIGSRELNSLPTFCAFENRPTDGIWIVREASAVALCTENADPVDGDHIQLVKPSSRTDPKFTRLATAVRKAINPGRVEPIVSAQSKPSLQIGTISQKVGHGAAIAGVNGDVNIKSPPAEPSSGIHQK